MEVFHPTLQPVTPKQCALLVTVPLTRDRFLADLAYPTEKDFANTIRRRCANARARDEYYWTHHYGALALKSDFICTEVEKLGVVVIRDAQLIDLARLIKQGAAVITLAAHWRFTLFTPEDIVDPLGFLAVMATPKTTLQQVLQQGFYQQCASGVERDKLRQLPGAELRKQLVSFLNPIINGAHKSYLQERPTNEFWEESIVITPELVLARLTRPALELELPQVFAAGKAIEFAEGLYSVAEVLAAIPQEFDRILDLTVCNSVVLGNAIKQRANQCMVAVNRRRVSLSARLYHYWRTMQKLHKKPAPYMHTLAQL